MVNPVIVRDAPRVCTGCGYRLTALVSPSRAGGRAPQCARCDAAVPAPDALMWSEVRTGPAARVARLTAALAFFATSAACSCALAALFVARPAGALEGAAASVLLPALVVFGGAAVLLLAALGAHALCARSVRYRGRDGARKGTLTLVLGGACVAGYGEVRGAARVVEVPGALRGVDALGTAFEILRVLGSTLGARGALRGALPTRWAADAVVLAAVLGLAARGRISLSLQSRHGWSRRPLEAPRTHAIAPHLCVTLCAGATLDDERGPFERALLAELARMGARAPSSPPTPPFDDTPAPYRGRTRPPADPAVPLRTLLRALVAPGRNAGRYAPRTGLWVLALGPLDALEVPSSSVRALDALESADDALLTALRASVREAFERPSRAPSLSDSGSAAW